jgi:hypothetical protein
VLTGVFHYVFVWALLLAHRACGSAYFVVAHRRKACLLVPPQHGGARFRRSQHASRSGCGTCLLPQSRSVRLLAPLAAMFAGLPPSSSELTERRSVVPPSPPADRRREHRESAAVVDRRGKNASARSSSVRRRAISRRSQLACRSGCRLGASRLESLPRRSSQRRPAVDLSDFAQQVGPSPSRPFQCLFAAPCGDPLVMAAHEHLGNIQPTPAGWFGVDRSLQ